MALVVETTKCFTVDAALELALLPLKLVGGTESMGGELGEDEKRLAALSTKRLNERYDEGGALSGGSWLGECDVDMVTDCELTQASSNNTSETEGQTNWPARGQSGVWIGI